MNNVFFGIANDRYDTGVDPAVAINRGGGVIEVHESDGLWTTLWYNLGVINGTEITWNGHGTINNDGGHHPSVAINESGWVVEAHDSGSGTLWYWVGQVVGTDVHWNGHDKIGGSGDNSGRTPSVAMDDSGRVVEVHDSGDGKLWYWVGQFDGSTILWSGHGPVSVAGQAADDGYHPSVAINASGQVLVVHETGSGRLSYWAGQLQSDRIEWTANGSYDDGTSPSVGLGDDGLVVETHESGGFGNLSQRLGRLTGTHLTWTDWLETGEVSLYYDDGAKPSVALRGGAAVQVHSSETGSSLYATVSLVFDRANWMQQYLSVLSPRPLNGLVMPASHDAATYPMSGLAGRTQDLPILSQLLDGVRWFDLRPGLDDGVFYLYHNFIQGPTLAEVLADIAGFMARHAELVLLKFSHWRNFDDGQVVFDAFFKQVYDALHPWMRATLPGTARLAEESLGELLGQGGTCVVLHDSIYGPQGYPSGAFRRYGDWYDPAPSVADLTVFDVYSNTKFLGRMISGTDPDPDPRVGDGTSLSLEAVARRVHPLPQGQLPKFLGSPGPPTWAPFTGDCQDGATVCDLFLLSWTLTPPTDVWHLSREANACLGPQLASVGANSCGRMINLLFTDYVQYSRSSDVALVRNGCTPGAPPVAVPLPAELPHATPAAT